jgi:ADP-ribose pyrophosphatase YjhB (NUDIX family)
MSKSANRAVAIVIRDSAGRLLVVRRSDDDPSLPGVWGLPAASLRGSETPVDAAVRAGNDKLGIDVRIVSLVGVECLDQGDRMNELSEYKVEVLQGEPAVPQPDRSVSQYVQLRYTDDPSILLPAARQGSLCSRILLNSLGIDWRPS